MEQKKEYKDLGNLQKLILNIDKPLEMKNMEMTMQNINLYVGQNGTGKSLILKIVWVMGMISLNIVTLGSNKIDLLKQLSQYILDHTFENNNFNGKIIAEYKEGSISIEIENGKITSVLSFIPENVKSSAMPVYMSTSMRTFQEIEQYLKTKELVGDEKISELYRLYDILFVEKLVMKFRDGILVQNDFEETLKKFDLDKYNIRHFYLEGNSFKFSDNNDNSRTLTSLSKGEQSLLNMSITKYIL